MKKNNNSKIDFAISILSS